MNAIDIHDAKTHLSRLVDEAVKGKPFTIAKAGKPLVRVTALDAPIEPQRLGFLAGEIEVPCDFDSMGADAIAALFGANAWSGGSEARLCRARVRRSRGIPAGSQRFER